MKKTLLIVIATLLIATTTISVSSCTHPISDINEEEIESSLSSTETGNQDRYACSQVTINRQ